MSAEPYGIHHVNIPIQNVDRTRDWYEKVFGLREFGRPFFQGGAPGVEEGHIFLMTRGNFGIHFTVHDDPPSIAPHHFAIEVQDWDDFGEHLKSLGIEYFNYLVRPQNGAKSAYLYDPDGNIVEIMFHPSWDHEIPRQPE